MTSLPTKMSRPDVGGVILLFYLTLPDPVYIPLK